MCSSDLKKALNILKLMKCNESEVYFKASEYELCRVLFVGHSTKTSLPRAALGKVLHSVTRSFIECRTLGTEIHSAKATLGKEPSTAV